MSVSEEVIRSLKIPAWAAGFAATGFVFLLVISYLTGCRISWSPLGFTDGSCEVASASIRGVTLRLREPVTSGFTTVKSKAVDTKSLGLKKEEGFCFITYITGNYEGDGEYIKVYVDQGEWYMKVHQDVGGGGIMGSAQCIEYVSEKLP